MELLAKYSSSESALKVLTCRIVRSYLGRSRHGATITCRVVMKNACVPLAVIQPRVGAEVVPVVTLRRIIHG